MSDDMGVCKKGRNQCCDLRSGLVPLGRKLFIGLLCAAGGRCASSGGMSPSSFEMVDHTPLPNLTQHMTLFPEHSRLRLLETRTHSSPVRCLQDSIVAKVIFTIVEEYLDGLGACVPFEDEYVSRLRQAKKWTGVINAAVRRCQFTIGEQGLGSVGGKNACVERWTKRRQRD